MRMLCLFCRPWRIPYAEQDPRGARGVFATLAWEHFRACPRCQSECARLRANGAALHRVSQFSRSRKSAVRDDLSSTLFAERVMTRVQNDERTRRLIRLRDRRRVTTAFSLGCVLAGAGAMFTLFGPPSLARTWFKQTFPAAHEHLHKNVLTKPPFMMHDPFGVGSVSASQPSARPFVAQVPVAAPTVRPPALLKTAITPAPIVVMKPVGNPAASMSVEDAREATIVAEEAERERWDRTRSVIVPAPSGARLVEAHLAPARLAAQNAPPLLLANAESTSENPALLRAKLSPATYDSTVTNSATTGDQITKPSNKPASQDDLRSLGLTPSTPPANAAPSADLGAPPAGGTP